MDEIVQMNLGRPKDLEKRQRILNSAKSLFLKQGYQGSSMNHIAAEAGVSKLTVYNHFQDKASLFTAAIEDTCSSLLKTNTFQLLSAEAFLNSMHELCRISLNMVCLPEAIKLEHLLFQLAAEQNPLAQQFYTASHGKMRQLWQDFFLQAIQLGCVKDVPVDELQHCIMSLLLGTRHHDLLLGFRAIPSAEEQQQIVQDSIDLLLLKYY